MVHKVIVRKRAIIQFQSICDYLAEEFGEHTADDFEFEVENCVATLRKFPESGHPEPIESKYQYRSKIVGKYNKKMQASRKNFQASRKNFQASRQHLQASQIFFRFILSSVISAG